MERLRQVLADWGIENDLELVRVDTKHDARTLRFPGSPTIRIDGKESLPDSGDRHSRARLPGVSDTGGAVGRTDHRDDHGGATTRNVR